MKNFLISIDSSASFTDAQIAAHELIMVHLSYTLDGLEHIDKFNSDTEKQALYNQLSDGYLAQSSKANPEAFRSAWEKPLSDGMNILHLSLSSKVSGSYESACQTAHELNAKYSGKVEVVDTLTGSFAISALALNLMEIQSTATLEEAKHIALDTLQQYNLIFTVGDIKYLRRGGRISHIKAMLGGLLHLKPVLFISPEGRITLLTNARGMRQAFEFMVEKMKRSANENTNSAYISHGGDIPAAERLQEKIVQTFASIKKATIDYLTPVLGLHAGPGSLVLCFRGAERENMLDESPLKELLEKIRLRK
jgi:DegV family protein with EDD domain